MRVHPVSRAQRRGRGWLVRAHRDEDGASAVIVGISIFVIFGAAMLAIDAGSLWTTRRHLILATDAAALAAAGHFADNARSACNDVLSGRTTAEDVFETNEPDGAFTDFVVEPADPTCVAVDAGHVSVQGDREALTFFAPIFGFTDARPISASTAVWGPLVKAEGLRPIGICNQDPHFTEWVSTQGLAPAYSRATMLDDPSSGIIEHPSDPLHNMYSGAGVVHRVAFQKKLLTACGDSPGNWGWLDFNANNTPNGSQAIQEWLENGYDQSVDLGAPSQGDEDCDPLASEDDCGPQDGALGGSVDDELDSLKCPASTPTDDCQSFLILVYDDVDGNGNNARYHPYAYLGVVLRGFNKVTGGGQPDSCGDVDPVVANERCPWFDFEFVRATFAGTVGPNPTPGIPTQMGIHLCGVDNDNAGIAGRCPY